MKVVSKIIYIVLVFYSAGCNENLTEFHPDLFGSYKSVKFIEPGSNDGGVDILSHGGFFNLTLSKSYEFTAELFIPDSINSNYAPGQRNYAGFYSLNADTVLFLSEYFLGKMQWKKHDKLLESYDRPARAMPFKIILKKFSEVD